MLRGWGWGGGLKDSYWGVKGGWEVLCLARFLSEDSLLVPRLPTVPAYQARFPCSVAQGIFYPSPS